jgi:glycosyltransferase involved in cell wall biosynthesis
MYRVGFIIEQALGHITHGQNLRRVVDQDPDINARWVLPAWQRSGLASRLPIYRSNWTMQSGLQTRRMLDGMQRELRPQVLFFHTQVTATLAPDWLRRIPSIVSLDATPRQFDRLGSAYHHAAGPAWLEQAKAWLSRRSFRLARHLVTWSAWAKQGLIDEYQVPAEKITVIPPGVDSQSLAPLRPGAAEDDALRILFVGGDFERKGGRVLLEAFRRLRQTLVAGSPSTRLGPPPELHVVTRDTLLPENGLFVYHGLEPNSAGLLQLYRECDIFCLPTFADALAMVLLEAGAAGLPLVATELAALPAIVIDGRTGLLVPPGDPGALTYALGRLAADRPLRLALGAGALDIVRRQFDAETNAQRLLELIKHLVNQEMAGFKP